MCSIFVVFVNALWDYLEENPHRTAFNKVLARITCLPAQPVFFLFVGKHWCQGPSRNRQEYEQSRQRHFSSGAGSYIYSYVPWLFSKIYQIETLQTAFEETLITAFIHKTRFLYKALWMLSLQDFKLGTRKRLHWFKFWRNFSAAKYHKFSDQLLIFFSLIYNFLLFSLYSSFSWAGLFKARLGYTKITANFDFTLATFSVWPNRNRSLHLTCDRNFRKFWHYGKHLVSPGKRLDWKSMTNSIGNFCVLLMIKEHNFTSLKIIKCVNITSIDKTINLYHAEVRNISWYPCSGG